MTAVDPTTRDLADALRNLMAMLDDNSRGLKAAAKVRSNDCGCHCCDDDGDGDEVRERVQDILESEAAESARRLLTRWEWR